MSKVKDEKNEKREEQPLVTYISVIKAPSYFKLFHWGKKLLKNIDATYEWVCMATSQGKWDTEDLMCGWVVTLEKTKVLYGTE